MDRSAWFNSDRPARVPGCPVINLRSTGAARAWCRDPLVAPQGPRAGRVAAKDRVPRAEHRYLLGRTWLFTVYYGWNMTKFDDGVAVVHWQDRVGQCC